MVVTKSRQPLLQLRFEGPAIRDGRILLDDLLQFVGNLDQAIERTITFLQTGTSIRVGRPLRATQILSALEVVAVRKGSFDLALDLRREDQAVLPGFDVGVQAVEQIMAGLEAVAKDAALPTGFDQGVLIALREAGRILDRGIEAVHITSKKLVKVKRVAYVQSTREKIISSIRRFDRAWTAVEGRLLMADVKEDSLRCRLHPSTGGAILCYFDETIATHIIRNLRNFVRARGEATVDPSTNRMSSLFIRDLELIGEPSQVEFVPILSPAFWSPKTFDELALEQGVYAVEDWDRFVGGWPEDTDFKSFLAAIRSSRED